MSLSEAAIMYAFNTTSRYLDYTLNTNNIYFDNMVSQIYPSELQLNKANTSDTGARFLDLHLSLKLLNSFRKRDKMLDKPRIYLFSTTCLKNSIKHEHSCKILY